MNAKNKGCNFIISANNLTILPIALLMGLLVLFAAMDSALGQISAWIETSEDIDLANNKVTVTIDLKWDDPQGSVGYKIKPPRGTEIDAESTDRSYHILEEKEFTVNEGCEGEAAVGYSCTSSPIDVMDYCRKNNLTGEWKVTSLCGSGSDTAQLGDSSDCGGCCECNGSGGGGTVSSCSTCGNPIEYRTGNKVQSQTLFSYPCKGGSVSLGINYNSGWADILSDVGYGWRHSYDIWFEDITPTSGSHKVRIFHIGGSDVIVQRYGDDDYETGDSNIWVDDTYFVDEEPTQVRLRIGTTAYIFQEINVVGGTKWKATSIINIQEEEDVSGANDYSFNDWKGFTTTLSYYDDTGSENEYKYGKLETLTEPGGREYDFIYWDDDYESPDNGCEGLLKYVMHPNGTNTLASFNYYYDDTTTNQNGNLIKVTDPVTQTTDYIYNESKESGQETNLYHMLIEVDYSCQVSAFFYYKVVKDSYPDPITGSNVSIVHYNHTKIGTDRGDSNGEHANDARRYRILPHFLPEEGGTLTSRSAWVKDINDNDVKHYYDDNKLGGHGSKIVAPPGDKTTFNIRDEYHNATREDRYDSNEDCWYVTLTRYYGTQQGAEPADAKEHRPYFNITRRYDHEPDEETEIPALETALTTTPDTTNSYDSLGRMTSREGTDGITHYWEYEVEDEVSHLIAEWDECSDETEFNKVEYEYYTTEDSGAYEYLLKKVKKHIDSEGDTLDTEYTYNSYGETLQVALKDDTTTLRTITYTYASTYIGMPLTMVEPAQATGQTRTTTYSYDFALRKTSEIRPPDTNSKSYKTTYTYECDTKIREILLQYGSDGAGWSNISRTRSEYNSITGDLIKEWVYKDPDTTDSPTTSNAILTAEYEYYDDGKLQWQKNAREFKTEYVYYEDGNLKEKRFYYDSSNYYKEEYTYYADGKRKTVEDYLSNLIDAGGGDPYYTQYAYDGYGRLSTITDPNDGVTEYTYIGATSLTNTIENAEGEITDYDYDDYNRVQYVTIDPGSWPHVNLVTEYEYDYLGRQTAVIDPEENRTEYTYDIQGRRTKVENADGTTIEYTYSAPGSVKTVTTAIGTVAYTYDELDRQLTVEDPEGNDTTYTYDTYEFVTNTRKDTVTDADSKTTDYTYNLRGRLVKLTDPEDKDTVYEYDDNGNMTKLTYTVNSVDYDTTFTYDYMDRPLVTTYPDTTTLTYAYDIYDDTYDTGTDKLYNKRTDRAGKVTVYYPDTLGRITETRYVDGSNDTVEKILYEYDDVGRVETATVKDDEDATLSEVGWTYDSAGRATQETQTLGGNTKTVSYQFNDVGAPTQITYPGGTVITHEYDNMNRLDTVKKSTSTVADYMYNAVGQPIRVDLLNGTRATYEYNKAGHMMKLQNLIASSGKVISSFAYDRSDAGYPEKITREDGFMINYSYDDNHQVTEEKMLNPQASAVYQHNYEYDEIGNRKSKWYDDDDTNKKVTYGYDTATNPTNQKLLSLSGTRGLKMTVTGTVSDLMEDGGKDGDIDKVEVTPAHTDGSKETGTMVKSSLRLPFWAARGVSFWDDTDNEVEAKAYDKAGNTTTDTTQSNITLDDDVSVAMTYYGTGCLESDGTYTYFYDYENRLIEVQDSQEATICTYQYDALGSVLVHRESDFCRS